MRVAQDMLELAEKYKKDVNELHQIFYEVNCSRDDLVRVLDNREGVARWSVLEDLALKGDPTSEAFIHVLKAKGDGSIVERKRFLGLD